MALPHGTRFVLPLRVYYEDTDAAGVVYYANYLRFLERARTEWLRALGYEQERLAQTMDLAFVVRSLSCEFRRPARLDQMLNVVAAIESMGRAQIVFDQRIDCQASGDLLLTASVRVACIAAASMKPTALPKDMYDTFNTLIANGARKRA